jgi:chemotaxis response regulator CheB
MPADNDPGMAFVLVQHLAPDHKSMLSELIRRYTRMPVFEVEDGMPVQVNSVYIIPPNHDMAFLNGPCTCWSPPRRAASACRLTFFSARWRKTSMSAPLALCCRAPPATAHWACAPSRTRWHGDGANPLEHRV